MNNSNMKSGCIIILLLLVGTCSLSFGLIALISGLSGNVVNGASPVPVITVGSFSCAVGIYCFITYSFIRSRAKKFNTYRVLIGNQKSVPIQWLSKKMNISQHKVLKDLRTAMSDGFFHDGHIDENRNLLLFPNDNSIGTIKTVICQNCGGGVELMSKYSGKCPYCGTIVND